MKNFIGFLKGFGVCILAFYALAGWICTYYNCSPRDFLEKN